MARRALCLREARRNVIRYIAAQRLGGIPVRKVAADASRVRAGQRIISVHVAQRASRCQVRAGQRETRGRMVKRRIRPGRRIVAGRTLCRREARRNVIWHIAAQRLRAVPICCVAAVASRIRRIQCVVAVHVAQRTGGRNMRARQREARRAVIKLPIQPTNRVVAGRAL